MKEGRKFSLFFKLSLLVLGAVVLLTSITIFLTLRNTRDLILKSSQEKATFLAAATANKIESYLVGVQVAPLNLAANLQTKSPSEKELLDLIRTMVTANHYVYGSTVAFEPNSFIRERMHFAPYYYEVEGPGSELKYLSLEPPKYDYFRFDWYNLPKSKRKAVWTDPYFDPGVQKLMATFSVPLYNGTGEGKEFQGVVTADLTMERLVEIVEKVKLYDSGHAFLVSGNGTFLSHPNPKTLLKESIFSVAGKFADPKIKDIGTRMIRGEEGYASLDRYFEMGKSWIFFAPIESGWSLAVVMPERELFNELNEFTRRYIFVSGITCGALLILILFISQRTTNPIKALANRTREIAKGNLDVSIPPLKSRDEIADLSIAFENMRVSLKDYIKNLEETTAAKSRFESELKIARTIQMSFLPRTFPPFPDREEFDLHAFLNPATEVGGDLYDFFFAENGTLYFLVGDVSDKGVPAALFMAATITLMRGFAHQASDPAGILSRVNRELCLFNDNMMFVTLLCGALNPRTGNVVYSNAGHNPPILVRNGRAEYLHPFSGFVMGVDPAFEYKKEEITLLPGDVMVVYSDGVTEAMNAEKQVFSEERLQRVVEKSCDGSASYIVDQIRNAVTEYAAGYPQSDDITVLVFRYNGDANTRTK